MKTKTRKGHIMYILGLFQSGKNAFDFIDTFLEDLTAIPELEQPFQPLVLEGHDHV
jgi:hypothetical protein